MKLPMSDDEIARRYRNSLEPKQAVKILAQLNAAGPSDIVAALARKGIVLNHPKKEPVPKRKRLDQRQLRQLYDQGLNDHQIAEQLGVSPSGIYAWRYRSHLPANGEAWGGKPRKKEGRI